jgi:hypothetical protein
MNGDIQSKVKKNALKYVLEVCKHEGIFNYKTTDISFLEEVEYNFLMSISSDFQHLRLEGGEEFFHKDLHGIKYSIKIYFQDMDKGLDELKQLIKFYEL